MASQLVEAENLEKIIETETANAIKLESEKSVEQEQVAVENNIIIKSNDTIDNAIVNGEIQSQCATTPQENSSNTSEESAPLSEDGSVNETVVVDAVVASNDEQSTNDIAQNEINSCISNSNVNNQEPNVTENEMQSNECDEKSEQVQDTDGADVRNENKKLIILSRILLHIFFLFSFWFSNLTHKFFMILFFYWCRQLI